MDHFHSKMKIEEGCRVSGVHCDVLNKLREKIPLFIVVD
jgi:hypothetical protein